MNHQSGKKTQIKAKIPTALLPKSATELSNPAQVGSTPSNCPICPFYWGCSQQHLAALIFPSTLLGSAFSLVGGSSVNSNLIGYLNCQF